MPYLTLVTAQCAQLHIKGFGDIGAVINILSSPEQYLLDLMRIKPFFRQIRVGKDIPGIREDSVQGKLVRSFYDPGAKCSVGKDLQ